MPSIIFKQRLLHAFAGHVAGDGRVFGFSGYFIDFVNVDDAALGFFHIVIGALQKFENDVFDVLAHVTGFCERGGVDDGERNVENPGQGLRHQGLAGTCRPDEEHIALL